MKNFRKVFCVLISVIMICSLLPIASFAEGDAALKFNPDGKFKIMMFADIQDNEDVEETTLQLMAEAIEKYQPDLCVYLGDNTVAQGYDNQYAAIKAVTEPCVSRNVPYAIVFGNHDQEQGVEKEVLLEMYREFNCLTYDAVPEMYGCGTCNLPIMSSDGAKIAFNLWLTDSGQRNPDKEVGGYDYVHPDQIEWYKETAAALKAANGGVPVPSINFQHIVVPEIYYALGFETLPITVGGDYTYMGKTFLPAPNFSTHKGMVFEHPCPPKVADGQLDAWVDSGDVIASFFGHDHTNSFETNYKGVDLTAVPTAGCNSYSNEINRGVGLITLDENAPADYTYELIHMYDMALADGSQISKVDGGKPKFIYSIYKFFSELLDQIHQVFLPA